MNLYLKVICSASTYFSQRSPRAFGLDKLSIAPSSAPPLFPFHLLCASKSLGTHSLHSKLMLCLRIAPSLPLLPSPKHTPTTYKRRQQPYVWRSQNLRARYFPHCSCCCFAFAFAFCLLQPQSQREFCCHIAVVIVVALVAIFLSNLVNLSPSLTAICSI